MRSVDLPASVVERRAVIYVRQSTSTQVHENLESQRRQYDLAELAAEYGFSNVVTIDEDLGRSAAGSTVRPGFESLIAQLCQGEVGAIFCLEASRLARNGREWHHLLEICGLVGARVIDADGAYDPSVPNDRLLLGLKGTMSEFELTLMRRRLVEGAQAKARRGEYRIGVPIGYRWGHEHGLDMDPDRRVQEAIRSVFRLFALFESARQVLLFMIREGLQFPRPTDAKRTASLSWRAPSYRNIISVLQNPFYAGAYAYGKSTHKTTMVGGRLSKSYGHERPMAQWTVLLREHHAGYVTWDDYERNQERLRRNAHRKPAGNPKSGRGGRALLSGLLRCRRCGRMLAVVYNSRRGGVARYVCRVGNTMHGLPKCVGVGVRRPDELVADEVLRAVEPLAVEAAIAAMDLAHEQAAERKRALELECEQARYAVQLAQRRYEAVDPDNRLVATELEARWNAALASLRACETRMQEVVVATSASAPSTALDKDALFRLADDLRMAWAAPTSDSRVKQQLVRALVAEIIVDIDDTTHEVVLVIHWRGGQHSEVRARKPASGEHRKRAPMEADAVIRSMAGTWSDEHIAATLNRMRLRTGQELTWTAGRVRGFRQKAGIRAYEPAANSREWVTMRDAAKHANVSSSFIRTLIQRGVLPAKQVVPDAPWQIRIEDLDTDAVRVAIARRHSTGRPLKALRDERTPMIPGFSRGDAQ